MNGLNTSTIATEGCTKLTVLALTIGWFASIGLPDANVQPPFGENMVLQRNTAAAFWGTASPDESVTVSGSWGATSQAKAGKDGKWSLKLKTPDAGGPFTVTVKGDQNTVSFRNVMSGEVWLCAGQSNMACTMSFFKDTSDAIAKAKHPNIRFFKMARHPSNTPVDALEGGWEECSPETTAGFSATGYFFGLNLHRELNIPIGLVYCCWGGTRIEAWTPWEKQKDNPRLVKEREEAAREARTYDAAAERRKFAEAQAEYMERRTAWEKTGKNGPGPKEPRMRVDPLRNINYSSNLYNGLVHPLAPYTVKGAIWQQGAENLDHADEYAKQLTLLIESWRERWGQNDLRFYFVQYPGFMAPWTAPVEEGNWPILREAFVKVARTVPHTGMAIALDLGEADNIHPGNKSEVGARLARLALYKDYGKKNVVWTGPLMKTCEFRNGKAVLTFENGGSPLSAGGNGTLKGFAVRDENGAFVEADAKIVSNDTVEVTSKAVAHPSVLYYAWANNPEGSNLINRAGLPASPFRVDAKRSLGR